MSAIPKKDHLFSQAHLEWDLPRLYKDLAKVKGKKLSEKTEKVYLRGLLCGHSPTEIAHQLVKTEQTVAVALCNSIYRYVKILLNKPEDEKLNNWNEIRRWLEKAGYKIVLNDRQPVTEFTEPVQVFSRIVNKSLVSNGFLLVNIHTSLIFPMSTGVGGGQSQEEGERQEEGEMEEKMGEK